MEAYNLHKGAKKEREVPVTVAPTLTTLETWQQKVLKPQKSIDWVVQDVAARGEIALLAAPGGVGKSLWSLQMGWCVIRGIPFHDQFTTVAGNVLILDNENGVGVSTRRAYKLNKNNTAPQPTHQIYYHEVPQHYFTANDENIHAVQKLISEGSIALVVIDSLVSVFPEGTTENTSNEVRSVMNRLRNMISKDEYGNARLAPPALLIIHHTSKGTGDDGWGVYRGSTDIQAAISTLIGMRAQTWFTEQGEEKQWVQFRFEKTREGATLKGIYQFSLEDQGHEDQNNPLHWFQYVSHAKQKDDLEHSKEWILTSLKGEMTKSDLVKRIKEIYELSGTVDINHSLNSLIQEKKVKRTAVDQIPHYTKFGL